MDKIIVLGTRKGTLILDKRGSQWKPRKIQHAGVSVSYAAQDPRSGTLWAALDHGHWGPKLSCSTDHGETWKDASSIQYPKEARFVAQYMPEPNSDSEGGSSKATKREKYKAANLLKIWTMAFGHASEAGVMYAGTIPGGLFRSNDGGESWELNRSLWNHESRGGDLFAGEATSENQWGGTPAAVAYGEFAPGIHSIVISPKNPKHMYVAVSSAGVLETIDGGRTWEGRNQGMLMDYLPNPGAAWGHDPHYVTACPTSPEYMWQQNHCGVFFSKDGARSWDKVSHPNLGVHFGFPIAVDEQDGNVAWVVPGQSDSHRMAVDGGLFVARTDDGGESWKSFREGLPQEHTYDVVYRHALDIVGNCLCFGSTSGNVYISEDRGETWQCLGNNFPPVHSVRFASQ